jgi:hypothetical protein
MSNFVDIYQDLPSRVSEAWQRLQQQEQQQSGKRDLSVTAMLMAAATGLAMPLENLKDVGTGNSANWNEHPSFANDNQRHYQAALKRYNDFSAQKLSTIDYLKSIPFMHCQSMSDIRDAIEGGIKGTQPWPKSPKVRCLIRILRNALAHNNIVAFGDNVNEIKKLGFFSEKKTKTGNNCTTKDGYLVLVIDTTAFQTFLKAWFDVIAPQTDSANDEQP